MEKDEQNTVWRKNNPAKPRTEEPPKEDKDAADWRTAGGKKPAPVEEKKVNRPVEADGWRTEKQRVANQAGKLIYEELLIYRWL